ncbi:MAG: sigma factor-like helix-turn-helix DNA-binding protein [Patescibacteria group bacterium]
MSEEISILDKIITSKQAMDISSFNPSDMVSRLLKLVSEKEEDILRRRYGLNGKNEETLEQIGKSYQVTRERIRQIENTAVSSIKNNKDFDLISHSVESIITNIFHQYGGIMEEEFFYNKLLSLSGESTANKNSVNFLISRLLSQKYKKIILPEWHDSWQLRSQSLDILEETKAVFLKILQEKAKPLYIDEVIKIFRESDVFAKHQSFLNDDVITSYLKVIREVSLNPYDEYGLETWGTIKPKRINDKIYLVLKKHGQPLHFTKIAEMINKAGFDHKKAYPPTVHNELILNKQYVLVGRGIYALKEWGYKSGVVADVLEEILRSEGQPLSREQLINKVLEKRMVKKNTILLALTDKSRFQKSSDDLYTLNINK